VKTISLAVVFSILGARANGAEINVIAASAHPAAVQQLIQHVRSTSARERLAQAGYTSPERAPNNAL